MNDDELIAAWTTLDPTASAARRMDRRVSGWLDARDTSMAAEWLGMFRVAPFATLGLAAASAVAITAVPLVWFVRTLM